MTLLRRDDYLHLVEMERKRGTSQWMKVGLVQLQGPRKIGISFALAR